MVTLEAAYDNVKAAYPNFTVIEGFEFRGKYAFCISGDNISYWVEVLKAEGTVVTADFDEMFDNLDEFGEAKGKAVQFDR